MNGKLKRLIIASAAIAALGPAAGAAQGREFTTTIDNPYMPIHPGSTWVYRETATDGTVQRIVVKATDQTKRIANGVTARVVRDTLTEKGKVLEDTYDWYAQDKHGNVWYLGEDTRTYEKGKVVSTAGSWQAGVGGARGGIVMPAHPRVGHQYRQEHYPGHAEDMARVLSIDEQTQVTAGHYKPTLLTREWNPLEPKALEYKLYARGVGIVLELGVSGDTDRAELLRFTR